MTALKELFLAARELPLADRAAWLDTNCPDPETRQQVERLLTADAGAPTWGEDGDAPVAAGSAAPRNPESLIGRSVGGCRIEELIAVGGMGAVFAATQERPERRVALKLLQPGLASAAMRRRFALEAEALGRLNHAHVAAVFGAGEVDLGYGVQPYLLMEYVGGGELGRYVTTRQPSLQQRTRLLLQIAEAVAHAHQQGVIHRDLKPANILIEEGSGGPFPKIVDFGIARITPADDGGSAPTAMTVEGQLLGTLGYMSPEQVSGDPRAIDTRTDVYALGALGYELFVGHPPLKLDGLPFAAAIDTIRDTEPKRAGTLVRSLRGDLETIIEKALSKEPGRRYATASEFAADLRRHLDHQPVLARPASASYRLRRFTRRNRLAVTAVAGIVLASLSGTVWALNERDGARVAEQRARDLLRETRAARDLAVAREVESSRTAEFLGNLLEAARPSVLGPEASIVDGLEYASRRAAIELEDMPGVAARVHQTLASAFLAAESHGRAEHHASAARDLATGVFGDDSAAACNARLSLAMVALRRGELNAAKRQFDELVVRLDAVAPPNYWLRAFAHAERARIATQQNDLAAASLLLDEAAAIDLSACTQSQQDTEAMRIARIRIRIEQLSGNFGGAIPLLEEFLTQARSAHGNAHDDIASALHDLARAKSMVGDNEGAIAHLREAVRVRREVLGETHPQLGRTLDALGTALRDHGRPTEAEPAFREALAIFESAAPDGSEDLAICCYELGVCLRVLEKLDQSRQTLERALEVVMRLHEGDDLLIAATQTELGSTLLRAGQLDAAEKRIRAGYEMRVRLQGEDHPAVSNALLPFAELERARGNLTAAADAYDKLADRRAKEMGAGHWYAIQARGLAAGCLADAGQLDKAIELFEEALAASRAGNAPPKMIENLLNALAVTSQELGDSERVQRYASELMEARAKR